MPEKFPGPDALQSAFSLIKGAVAEKQPMLTGTPGQVVGFNEAGEAQAVAIETDKKTEIVQVNGVLRARAVVEGVLQSIYIQTPPAKKVYFPGEIFDPSGMVVMGKYLVKDDVIADVEVTGCAYPTEPITVGTTQVAISYFEGGVMCKADVKISVRAIYGVKWDGTSTTKLTRTDAAAEFTDPVPYVSGAASCGSPFDDLQPWAGMVRMTDSEAGELVAIPKFWYKWTKSGNTLKLQISDGQVDGFYVSPAHADRGDGKGERDVVYVGRYHCHTSNYKSQAGGRPKTGISRSAARTGIHNLGSAIWQFDLAMRQTLQMLYLVEFADWNSQVKIGLGCGSEALPQDMGYTDSMPYHTGTTQASRTAYGLGTQYRYIEGLWDNVYDWLDGCCYSPAGMSAIMNPGSFSDTANGTIVGEPTSGWIAAFDVVEVGGLQWVIPSSTSGGSDFAYVSDSWSFSASDPCLYCGGSYNRGFYYGLFFAHHNSASHTSGSIGCRLQKLPDPEEGAA